MFKSASPLFLVVETPLHAGSGSELGAVDLPIQRERHTNFPKIEGSGLKGSIREVFEELSLPDGDQYKMSQKKEAQALLQYFKSVYKDLDEDKKKDLDLDAKLEDKKKKGKEEQGRAEKKEYKKENNIILTRYQEALDFVFGPESGNAHAGAVGFTDARILLFPVKSVKGVFGWITCPQVLKRFVNDLNLCNIPDKKKTAIPVIPEKNTSPNDCKLFIKDKKIVFEEFPYDIIKDQDENGNCSKLAKWFSENLFPQNPDGTDCYSYWRNKIQKDMVVLPDEDFRDFVNLSTEVITRTKISNKTGTVEKGALFTEEYLPSESILYSLTLASPIFKGKKEEKGIFSIETPSEEELVMNFMKKGLPEVMQIGGNATIGKGIVRTKLLWEVN